ncbi:GNAT family N-acetyltransferase [Roseiconus nitratireducens]|nr:GNAT family N-acetyltransferase [Roseiconus nitratireducens]
MGPSKSSNTAPSTLQVHRTSDLRRLLADRPTWGRLACGVPFRDPRWLAPWWDSFSESAEAYALVASDERCVIRGVLPLYRRSNHGYRDLNFVGDGAACSDYVSIACRPQDSTAVAQAMAAYLMDVRDDPDHGWDGVEIDGIAESDETMRSFAQALLVGGAAVHAHSRQSTWLSARRATWEDHLRSMAKTTRRKVRRFGEQIDGAGGLTKRVAETENQVDAFLDELIDLHQRRWRAEGVAGSYHDSRMVTFIHSVAQAFFLSQRLYLPTLWKGDRMVSAELHMIGDDRRLYCYSSGYDIDSSHLQPGRVLLSDTLRELYRRDWTGIDFLRGDEIYKRRMAATPQRIVCLRVFSPSAAGRIRFETWSAGFNAKQWLRRRLGIPPLSVVGMCETGTPSR